MPDVTRRDLLGVSGLAAATLVGQSARAEAEPAAAAGPMTHKFRLEAQKPTEFAGGSTKAASVREFPISQGIAGVSMRLKPGGLRELHWHANAAEWNYFLTGKARITVFQPDDRWDTAEYEPGDVCYIPRGFGHYIENIGDDECWFILTFDNGEFDEFSTFSFSGWLATAPRDVLAKNLGLSEQVLASLPKKEVYMALEPPSERKGPAAAPGVAARSSPLSHKFRLEAQQADAFSGGTNKLVSMHEMPVSTTMTGSSMRLKPGGLRELHWHPHADEWLYVIKGQARITVFRSHDEAETQQYDEGDICYIPRGFGHYLENRSSDETHLLIVFNSGEYQAIDLTGWLAATPRTVVAANLGISASALNPLPGRDLFITRPGAGS
jgi:oxalate decarboxylase